MYSGLQRIRRCFWACCHIHHQQVTALCQIIREGSSLRGNLSFTNQDAVKPTAFLQSQYSARNAGGEIFVRAQNW